MTSMYISYIIAETKDIIFPHYDALYGSRIETVEESKINKGYF